MREQVGANNPVVGVGRLGLRQGCKGDTANVEGADKGHLGITDTAVDFGLFPNGFEVEAVR
jgi:hypothetical protein